MKKPSAKIPEEIPNILGHISERIRAATPEDVSEDVSVDSWKATEFSGSILEYISREISE